ncbi:MAG: hypothetical protein GXO71_06245 [Caldiserica bacterium]|nr:hypothetical protein [Caldisericota bacterium]
MRLWGVHRETFALFQQALRNLMPAKEDSFFRSFFTMKHEKGDYCLLVPLCLLSALSISLSVLFLYSILYIDS